MFYPINNEVFTSPEKCINECEKQIEFSKGIISYLEQYIIQLESIKTMAESAKKIQEINPLNAMLQMMNMNKKKDDE
jgi:hypothetical protein